MIQRPQRQSRSNLLPQLVFLCLTFVAAVGGAYFALRLFGDETEQSEIPQIITVEIIITATSLPTKLATTAPLNAQRPQVDLPADIAAEADGASSSAINPDQLGAQDVVLSTPTVAVAGGPVLAQNCYHSIVAGDTPFALALRYGVDMALMLEVNNLTTRSATNLQIGDILRVPRPGCQFDGVAIEVPAAAPAALATAPPAATSTPVTAEFEIVEVLGLGDITAEAVRLRNRGGTINISGWTLADADGNVFTFRETLLFPQSTLILYSRSGTSTSDARFWARDEAVWSADESLTLSDAQGRVLQTLQIPAAEGQ